MPPLLEIYEKIDLRTLLVVRYGYCCYYDYLPPERLLKILHKNKYLFSHAYYSVWLYFLNTK